MNDAKERKRKERARRRGDGFALVSEWIHRDDVDLVRNYLRRIRRKREPPKPDQRGKAGGVGKGKGGTGAVDDL